MATIQKRGISLLLVLVLMLGMIPSVSAAEIDTEASTEPAETTAPVPEETLAAETSPPETTQPEETSSPETTEPEPTAPAETAPEETEPPETQPEETDAVNTLSAEHQRILDALPQASIFERKSEMKTKFIKAITLCLALLMCITCAVPASAAE